MTRSGTVCGPTWRTALCLASKYGRTQIRRTHIAKTVQIKKPTTTPANRRLNVFFLSSGDRLLRTWLGSLATETLPPIALTNEPPVSGSDVQSESSVVNDFSRTISLVRYRNRNGRFEGRGLFSDSRRSHLLRNIPDSIRFGHLTRNRNLPEKQDRTQRILEVGHRTTRVSNSFCSITCNLSVTVEVER